MFEAYFCWQIRLRLSLIRSHESASDPGEGFLTTAIFNSRKLNILDETGIKILDTEV